MTKLSAVELVCNYSCVQGWGREDCKFEASLGNTARTCLQIEKEGKAKLKICFFVF